MKRFHAEYCAIGWIDDVPAFRSAAEARFETTRRPPVRVECHLKRKRTEGRSPQPIFFVLLIEL